MGIIFDKNRTIMKLFAAVSAFAASANACGGTVNEFQSAINSPVWYNGYYDNYLDCVWNIELGDVTAFTIVNNFFDVEYQYNCGYDYLKVEANGEESNFCGETYGSYEASGRKRRSEDEKEDPKYTYLENVSNDGFPDRMFIEGGSATITLSTDYSVRHQGFNFVIEKPSRFEVISYHVGRVVDSAAEQRWGSRYADRMAKTLNRLAEADTGVSCYDENVGSDDVVEGDEITVFDADNMCKLNGQVNAAINSYARNNACEGRGKVYRQIIRSARKVKNFFSDKNDC